MQIQCPCTLNVENYQQHLASFDIIYNAKSIPINKQCKLYKRTCLLWYTHCFLAWPFRFLCCEYSMYMKVTNVVKMCLFCLITPDQYNKSPSAHIQNLYRKQFKCMHFTYSFKLNPHNVSSLVKKLFAEA